MCWSSAPTRACNPCLGVGTDSSQRLRLLHHLLGERKGVGPPFRSSILPQRPSQAVRMCCALWKSAVASGLDTLTAQDASPGVLTVRPKKRPVSAANLLPRLIPSLAPSVPSAVRTARRLEVSQNSAPGTHFPGKKCADLLAEKVPGVCHWERRNLTRSKNGVTRPGL